MDEAIAAVTAAAWTDQPDEWEAPEVIDRARTCLMEFNPDAALAVLNEWVGKRRTMIHTMSGFGCDLQLEDAIKRIRDAEELWWSWSLFAHELLAIGPGDKGMRFDVRRLVSVPLPEKGA